MTSSARRMTGAVSLTLCRYSRYARRLLQSVVSLLVLFSRPKDAVKALKKRIVGNKNFREVMLALIVSVCVCVCVCDPLCVSVCSNGCCSVFQVLETCVKNCGSRFHVHVCSKEFVEGVLVSAILPKNNPPMILHDRVLSLIQVKHSRRICD